MRFPRNQFSAATKHYAAALDRLRAVQADLLRNEIDYHHLRDTEAKLLNQLHQLEYDVRRKQRTQPRR